MKFIKKDNYYFGRIEKDEEIVFALTDFCKKNEIRNGMVYALGAAQNLKLGYYDIQSRKYIFKDFKEDYEITSLLGNITLLNDEPFLHLHITISDNEFHSFGGHLVSGMVSLTCEFVISPIHTELQRKPDLLSGLNLIDF